MFFVSSFLTLLMLSHSSTAKLIRGKDCGGSHVTFEHVWMTQINSEKNARNITVYFDVKIDEELFPTTTTTVPPTTLNMARIATGLETGVLPPSLVNFFQASELEKKDESQDIMFTLTATHHGKDKASNGTTDPQNFCKIVMKHSRDEFCKIFSKDGECSCFPKAGKYTTGKKGFTFPNLWYGLKNTELTGDIDGEFNLIRANETVGCVMFKRAISPWW